MVVSDQKQGLRELFPKAIYFIKTVDLNFLEKCVTIYCEHEMKLSQSFIRSHRLKNL